jgi:hypothetical protein
LFNNLKNAGRHLYRNSVFEKPNDERIKAFYDETLRSRDDVMYIGCYLLIKEIMAHENDKGIDYYRMYCKLVSNAFNSGLRGELIKELLYTILDKFDMNNKTEATNYIVSHFVKFGDEEMQDTVKSMSEKYGWIKQVYDAAMKAKKEQEKFYARHSILSNASTTAFVTVDAARAFDIIDNIADAPF